MCALAVKPGLADINKAYPTCEFLAERQRGSGLVPPFITNLELTRFALLRDSTHPEPHHDRLILGRPLRLANRILPAFGHRSQG